MNGTQTTLPENTESQSTMPLFIEDGWTIKGVILPEAGLHPGLTFHYRPMTWLERRKMAREQEAERDLDKQDLIRSKQMANRIIDWSAGVPVSSDSICRLHGSLFGRLESVIYGLGAPDSIEVERKN